jgi:hypothetical protein
MPSYADDPHSQADILSRDQLEESMAQRMWFFLAALIGLATLVNWISKMLAALRSSRTRTSAADFENRTVAGQESRSNMRFPSALAASFRSFAYRHGLPFFGNTLLFSELGFMLSYLAATLALLFIQCK